MAVFLILSWLLFFIGLALQFGHDLIGVFADFGSIDVPRARQVHTDLSLYLAGAGGEYQDAVSQAGGFPRVVRDGDDRLSRSNEDLLQVAVEFRLGQRVE